MYPLLTTSTLIELLPSPLPQTPHGHLAAFCITFCCSQLVTILVLFVFTLMPLFSTLSFHSLSRLIRSSSASAITTNSYGKATLNSLDKASMTITNSNGLNAEPWCILTFTSKQKSSLINVQYHDGSSRRWPQQHTSVVTV